MVGYKTTYNKGKEAFAMTLIKKGIVLLLVCGFLLTVLWGCKANTKKQSDWPALENYDQSIWMANSSDFANCPRHDLPFFTFFTPDTITLVRDNAVVGEYQKGNANYEKILQMHTQSLEKNLEDYKTKYKDQMKYPFPYQTMGIVGGVAEAEDGLRGVLTGGTYLVYTYNENAYAPVYFDMKAPTEISQVIAAQPVLEGQSGGPFGFNTSQELWDYLKTL